MLFSIVFFLCLILTSASWTGCPEGHFIQHGICCPRHYVYNKNLDNCYRYFKNSEDRRRYPLAKAQCESQSGSLLILDSKAKTDLLKEFLAIENNVTLWSGKGRYQVNVTEYDGYENWLFQQVETYAHIDRSPTEDYPIPDIVGGLFFVDSGIINGDQVTLMPGVTGTLYGSPVLSDKRLAFDGIDDYIDFGQHPDKCFGNIDLCEQFSMYFRISQQDGNAGVLFDSGAGANDQKGIHIRLMRGNGYRVTVRTSDRIWSLEYRNLFAHDFVYLMSWSRSSGIRVISKHHDDIHVRRCINVFSPSWRDIENYRVHCDGRGGITVFRRTKDSSNPYDFAKMNLTEAIAGINIDAAEDDADIFLGLDALNNITSMHSCDLLVEAADLETGQFMYAVYENVQVGGEESQYALTYGRLIDGNFDALNGRLSGSTFQTYLNSTNEVVISGAGSFWYDGNVWPRLRTATGQAGTLGYESLEAHFRWVRFALRPRGVVEEKASPNGYYVRGISTEPQNALLIGLYNGEMQYNTAYLREFVFTEQLLGLEHFETIERGGPRMITYRGEDLQWSTGLPANDEANFICEAKVQPIELRTTRGLTYFFQADINTHVLFQPTRIETLAEAETRIVSVGEAFPNPANPERPGIGRNSDSPFFAEDDDCEAVALHSNGNYIEFPVTSEFFSQTTIEILVDLPLNPDTTTLIASYGSGNVAIVTENGLKRRYLQSAQKTYVDNALQGLHYIAYVFIWGGETKLYLDGTLVETYQDTTDFGGTYFDTFFVGGKTNVRLPVLIWAARLSNVTRTSNEIAEQQARFEQTAFKSSTVSVADESACRQQCFYQTSLYAKVCIRFQEVAH